MPDLSRLVATNESQIKIMSTKIAALEKKIADLELAIRKSGDTDVTLRKRVDALESGKKDKASADEEAKKAAETLQKTVQLQTTLSNIELRLKTTESVANSALQLASKG